MIDNADNLERRFGQALAEFGDMPVSNTVVEHEQRMILEFRKKMVTLSLSDANYDRKCAYYKGQAEAILELWRERERLRSKYLKKEESK